MIFNKDFLANFTAGYRLNRNMIRRADRSHPDIFKIVKLVTKGSRIRINNVIMVPIEIPTAKLESKTIRLCAPRIATTVFGFMPMARRIANS